MKTLMAGIAALVAVTACGSTSVARHSMSTPSPAAVGSPATLASCRLPIGGFVPGAQKGQPDHSTSADGYPNQQGMGGFLDLSTGEYTQVATSDRAYVQGTWLPVLPSAVSPDRNSYAVTRGSNLYLGDAKSRTERLLHAWPAGVLGTVVAFTADGIYVMTLEGGNQPQPGGAGPDTQLVLVRTDSGTVSQVPGSARPAGAYAMIWSAVSAGAAWGALMTISAGVATNALIRLDLATGETAKWWAGPGFPAVSGFDSNGHPLIPTSLAGPAQLEVITAPGQVTTVAPQGGTFNPGRPSVVSDSHGAWFGSADGAIWLYATDGVFKKVGSVQPNFGGSGQPYDLHSMRSVAGPCV